MGGRIRTIDLKKYVTETIGEPTLRDILAELEKPGRDPRAEFKYATFREGVKEISDLQPGMELEGIITNVANFGAFVDIGVHQDGLVHISQLVDRFVSDPKEIVKVGQVVKVKVLEVNESLKRIGLSMKDTASSGAKVNSNGNPETSSALSTAKAPKPSQKRSRQKSTGTAPAPTLEDLQKKFGKSNK